MPPPTDNVATPFRRQGAAPAAARPQKPKRPPLLSLALVLGFLAGPAQRPGFFAIAAAVIGLGAAAAGLLHPAAHDLAAVPPGDVALVNQKPILTSDFVAEVEQTTGGSFDDADAKTRAQVLHQMIDEELLVQRSLTLDLPEQDVDVRNALIDGVIAQVNAETSATRPTDAQLRTYFNAHRSSYGNDGSMNLVDLVLHVGGFENVEQSVEQAMADAAQAVYDLRSGQTLDYVKQHYGFADSGKMSGDQFDFAAKLHLGPKLYAAAANLSDGEVSQPIADTDGVHVIYMNHRQPPVLADFERVRNNVFTDYVNVQKDKAKQDTLNFLRANAQILLAPGRTQ